jgi:histidinol-phosphate aminotransferase
VVAVVERAAERVLGVPVYRPGRASPGADAGKLSSNEAPLGPSPHVRAAIQSSLARVNRYPEPAQALDALARYAGTSPDRLILTNGSDELCYLVATLLLGPGRIAVVGEPCYQIDATASLVSGASVRRVPLRHGGHDLVAMARASADASVVWLPSPHNPTGVACDPFELSGFLCEVPEECLVVLDEAYRAFSDPEVRPDVDELLARHPNLLVQRTLSKDFALAGLRIGYGLASAPLIDALSRARPPFSVNVLALAALEAAVADDGGVASDARGPSEASGPSQANGANQAWRAMSVDRVRQERARLEDALGRLGVEYFPSQANFVTAKLDPDMLLPLLAAAGTVVRSGADLGLPGWARISIGWAPQMAVLRKVLYTRLGTGSQTGPLRSDLTRKGPHEANAEGTNEGGPMRKDQ